MPEHASSEGRIPITEGRIPILQSFLENDAADSFSRYALAQEYLKYGHTDLALREFNTLLTQDADYAATYYHLGKLYERLGNPADAKLTYQNGIAVTQKIGDAHATKELREALFLLTGGDD